MANNKNKTNETKANTNTKGKQQTMSPTPAKDPTKANPPVLYLGQKVYVKDVPGRTKNVTYMAEVVTYPKPTDKQVEVKIGQDKIMIDKTCITAQVSPTYPRYGGYQRGNTYTPPVPKKKFSETVKPSADETYMAELFCAKTHNEVVTLGVEGVDDKKYEMIANKEWFAMIPTGLKDTDKIPCLIAHTDLHPNLTHPTLQNLEYEDGKFSSPTGLGADDRAGIFAINQMLRKYPGKFMVLFPDKEEVGLVGSRAFADSKHFERFDKHASMYISIDRRREHTGGKTIATYGSDCDDLNKWVAKLTDRKIVSGSSTDCKALATKSSRDVPCFNFSCAYTSEHTRNETLYFEELLETVKDLGTLLAHKDAYKTYAVTPKSYGYGYGYGYNYGGYYDDDDYMSEYYKDSGKPSTNAKNAKTVVEDDDVDTNELDDGDIEILKDIYAYYTGSEYDPKGPYIVQKIVSGDYVRLRTDLVIGQVYGGVKFTADLKITLQAHTWDVITVDDDLKMDLESVDGTYDCSLIPQIWMELVGKDDPMITKIKKVGYK